jgi:OTU-like cysteine protease
MRVLLPFGGSKKGNSSDTGSDTCDIVESSASFNISYRDSSTNNLQGFNCRSSDLNEEVKLDDLLFYQDSSDNRGGDKETTADVAFAAEESIESVDQGTQAQFVEFSDLTEAVTNTVFTKDLGTIPFVVDSTVSEQKSESHFSSKQSAHTPRNEPAQIRNEDIKPSSISALATSVSSLLQESHVLPVNQLCSTSQFATQNIKKRRCSSPIKDQSNPSQRAALKVPLSSPLGLASSTRLCTVTDPQFLLESKTKDSSMAVGGRFKSDSDDESTFVVEPRHPPPSRFWVQPAENEPPLLLHNHPFMVSSSINSPGVDEREAPVSSVGVIVKDGNASTSSGDKDEIVLAQFCNVLKKQGLELVDQEGDGNCLFRAVSLQVYGSAENHGEVRERCMDYMARNEEHYSDFIASTGIDEVILPSDNGTVSAFQGYIARKRINGVHGNHIEIQAISELFNRPVEVYTPSTCVGDNLQMQPINIFHEEYKTSDPPIRLSYHDGNHYNAIVDPLVPTAGLGLGLPGLKPGLADQMQITKAKTESDHLADEMELARVLNESREELLGRNNDELQRVLKESSRDFVSFVSLLPVQTQKLSVSSYSQKRFRFFFFA